MALITNGGHSFVGNVNAHTFNGVQIYAALLTQAGTAAPVATVLRNDLSGAVVWAYTSTGFYTATLTGAFISAATGIQITLNTVGIISAVRTDANVVTVKTYTIDTEGATIANDVLAAALLEIKVYNL